MTIARINDSGEVVEVGLPSRLAGSPTDKLHRKGWRPVKGTPKPAKPKDGKRHVYGAPYTYDADEGAVYGTWSKRDIVSETTQKKRERMVVSPLQAKAVLREMGVRQQVEDAIAEPDTDPLIKDAWAEATQFRRLSPAIVALGDKMGWSEDDLDDMFEKAAEINA